MPTEVDAFLSHLKGCSAERAIEVRKRRADEERAAAEAAARLEAEREAAERAELSRQNAAIRAKGYDDGYDQGYDRGLNEGWAGGVQSGAEEAQRLFAADLAAARAEFEAEVLSQLVFLTVWAESSNFSSVITVSSWHS